MKKILGLDLGTNSIGWAVVQMKQDENGNMIGAILVAMLIILPS